MSPPRRRRRRRGRGEQPESASPKRTEGQPADGGRGSGTRSRSRGRRRGRGGGQRQPASPLSSEDLVRGAPKERPATLSAPPDGQTLEKLIGDLQSEWGVPQYPQEYRITIKVADERDSRSDRPVVATEPRREASNGGSPPAGPKREKAPAAPRVVSTGTVEREAAPKRRRGRRRRRRGSDPGPTPNSSGSAPSPDPDPIEGGSQGDSPAEG
jgi:hypothetical protein